MRSISSDVDTECATNDADSCCSGQAAAFGKAPPSAVDSLSWVGNVSSAQVQPDWDGVIQPAVSGLPRAVCVTTLLSDGHALG